MGSKGEAVPADAVVTQTGHVTVRTGDVWHRMNYMSAIEGQLTPAEAVPLVSRGDQAGTADAVRYASVAKLTKAGFSVKFWGSRSIPTHVRIDYDGDWDEQVRSSFGNCFCDYLPYVEDQ